MMLAAAIAAFTALTACTQRNNDCSILIDPEIPATQMADSLSENLSCADAAASIVEWLGSERGYSLSYARTLTQHTAYNYGDSTHLFLEAIDSISTCLAPKERAKILVRTCEPQRLGIMMRGDDDESVLVPLIEDAYESDSTRLAAFRAAYEIK